MQTMTLTKNNIFNTNVYQMLGSAYTLVTRLTRL